MRGSTRDIATLKTTSWHQDPIFFFLTLLWNHEKELLTQFELYCSLFSHDWFMFIPTSIMHEVCWSRHTRNTAAYPGDTYDASQPLLGLLKLIR